MKQPDLTEAQMNSPAVYGWEIEKNNIFPLRAFKRKKTFLKHFTKSGFIASRVRSIGVHYCMRNPRKGLFSY